MYKTQIILIIVVVSLIFSIIFGYFNYRRRKNKFDYYTVFIIGVLWAILGIIFSNRILLITGTIMIILGYAKHNSWKEGL